VTGSLVSPALRERIRGVATPVATALGRLGLTPNALTVIGFIGTCLAAYAAAQQAWLAAGILVLAFGIFDLFDGTLARATGKVTKFGAFLDSTLDRAGEGIVYLGLVVGLAASGAYGATTFPVAAMIPAFMVSYTRAKAESLGFGTGNGLAAVGLAPREVRVGLLGVALIIASFVVAPPPTCTTCAGGAAYPLDVLVLEAVLGVIAILATITTIQRILVVRAQAKEG
jgi:CDP-diacylglycerol--glycerol-3-phosphate 3-phosphatidyltransferase